MADQAPRGRMEGRVVLMRCVGGGGAYLGGHLPIKTYLGGHGLIKVLDTNAKGKGGGLAG